MKRDLLSKDNLVLIYKGQQSDISLYADRLRRIDEMKLVIWREDTGYWQTDFPVNNKRIRKKTPFTNKSQKAEAKEFAKEIYMRMLRGDLFEECQTTFKEMADIYLRDRVISDEGKKYRLPQIYNFIGDVRLDKITPIDYENIKNYLKKGRGVKNQTVNRYLADVSAILNLAKKQGLIKDFPTITKLDNEEPRETRALTTEELRKIRLALPEYLRDPFDFSLSSGWRKGNIVNFTRRHLTKRPDGTYKVNFSAEEMKTGKPFEHICTIEETEIINRNISLEHEHIFRRDTKVNGTKTNHLGDFKKAIITAREKSGIFFTWHWLRHTRATHYAQQGVQEQMMNKLMAWSPKSRMAGNYSHLRDEDFLADLRQRIEDKRHDNDTRNQIEQTS